MARKPAKKKTTNVRKVAQATKEQPVAASWKQKIKIAVLFPYLLLVFGFTGLAASVTIAVEKAHLLQHPKVELVCDLNPLYSCGNVIMSPQSKTFGISNENYGIILFSGILAVGLMTLAGARPKKWFWQLFFGGMFAFALTILYLWHLSIYVIGSICLFCTSVWISAWTVCMVLFSWMYDEGLFKSLPQATQKPLAWVRQNSISFWLGWILLLAALTVKHFWYFYGPHLGF